jgi:hypothetical protein
MKKIILFLFLAPIVLAAQNSVTDIDDRTHLCIKVYEKERLLQMDCFHYELDCQNVPRKEVVRLIGKTSADLKPGIYEIFFVSKYRENISFYSEKGKEVL